MIKEPVNGERWSREGTGRLDTLLAAFGALDDHIEATDTIQKGDDMAKILVNKLSHVAFLGWPTWEGDLPAPQSETARQADKGQIFFIGGCDV